MAIETATIQVRRGKEADLDKSKLLSGEFAVTTDTHKVFATPEAGYVKELASKEDVEEIINDFQSSVDNKIDEAVAEVTSEMEDAIVGIENKKAEALASIPEDYTALDAEVKALAAYFDELGLYIDEDGDVCQKEE